MKTTSPSARPVSFCGGAIASPLTIYSWRTFFDDCLVGMFCYWGTSFVVAVGVFFSAGFVRSPGVTRQPPELIERCVRFDGTHYRDIVRFGYDYDPARRSTVAFFPAYPLTVRAVAATLDIGVESALVLVSNAFLALAFVALAVYSGMRFDDEPASQTPWTLLTFGLWPTTLFFRMAYAESLFVLTALLTLIGIHRRWPLLLLAVVAGIATSTRPVGIAVAAAFIWHVVTSSGDTFARRLGSAALLTPIACWGLLAFMGFQYVMFGNAFGFAQTQQHWTNRMPVAQPELVDKALALLTVEPIRGIYGPGSPRYWGRASFDDDVLFNLYFWNPVLFLVSAGLVMLGAARKWLTGPEVVLGAALLAIPYLTRSYEMSMNSHARFAAAVVVIYPVIGRLLGALPLAVSGAAIALSGAILLCWSALYTAGYVFF